MSERPGRVIEVDRALAKFVAAVLGIGGILVGLVALISAGDITENTVALVAFGVGVVGLAGYVLLDPGAIRTALTGRQARYASNALLMSVALAAILVISFVILLDLEARPGFDWMSIDLTEDKQFSLSEQTLDLLGGLEEPVHIIGFYSSSQATQRDGDEIWLQEYQRQSNGMLTYEFVDPILDPGRAREYGVDRTGVLVFTQGDRTAQASFADERNMTGALISVLKGEPKQVYALTGHGELSTEDFQDVSLQQATDALTRQNYVVQPFNLFENAAVPEDAAAVIIAGPTTQYRPEDVQALDTYLEGGGSLLVMLEPNAATGIRTSGFQDVAYSPDGLLLGTASADDTAQLWDTATNRQVATLSGHTGDVQTLAFSPDGERVATGSGDTTIRVWNTSGTALATLEGHQASVWSVDWSPDGDRLASAGLDQAVIIWDAASGEAESVLTGQSAALDVAFSPDGQSVAAGFADGSVRVWDVSGEEIANQRPHVAEVMAVAFSPDGSTVLSGGWDGAVGVLDVNSGVATPHQLFSSIPITDLTFLGEGRVVMALADLTLRVWDAGLESEQFSLQSEQNDLIWEVAASPDGTTLAAGSGDGTVDLWDLDERTRVETLRGTSSGDPLLAYLGENWGISVNDDLVIDTTPGLPFGELTPIASPRGYGFSPIMEPLSGQGLFTFFPAARSLRPADEAPEGVTLTGLVRTSENSWGETNLVQVLQQGAAADEADSIGPLDLAVSAENSDTGARVVVVGDADFATNASLQREAYGNLDFFVNTVNWLAEEEELINIQPRGGDRLFQTLPPVAFVLVNLGVLCFLPLLVLGLGVVVWLRRRSQS